MDLDIQNDEGDTPLLLACQSGQAKTLSLLIRNGASAAIQNKFGENALHFAWCFFGSDARLVVDELVSSGAALDAVALGWTTCCLA